MVRMRMRRRKMMMMMMRLLRCCGQFFDVDETWGDFSAVKGSGGKRRGRKTSTPVDGKGVKGVVGR